MGKEIEEQIEDVLGLNESKEEVKEEVKKEEPATQNENITLTPDQVEIHSEITKLDVAIEKLKDSSEVDMDKFYDGLEDSLSESEIALEVDDRPAYLKLVSKREKEYIKANSNDEKLKELEEKKSGLVEMNSKQEGILEVTSEFPDYDHEKMITFFEDELTKKEQKEIFKDCVSFGDVYKNTYKKFVEVNPKEIKKDSDKPLPNLNNTRRQSATNSEVEDGISSEEDDMRDALGL